MSIDHPAAAPFEHTARIHFYQADPATVLFYGRLFELVQDTFEELLRSAGVDVDDLLALRSFATPIVHAEADYFRPIFAGEAVTVRGVIEHLGESSFTLSYSVFGHAGDLRATARVVHVCVDRRAFTKIRIPEAVRRQLEAAPWQASVLRE